MALLLVIIIGHASGYFGHVTLINLIIVRVLILILRFELKSMKQFNFRVSQTIRYRSMPARPEAC